MKKLRKPYEQNGGKTEFGRMSIMAPKSVIEELDNRLERGQKSGFAWRALALLLALTNFDDPLNKKEATAAILRIVECFNESETKSFGERLVEAGGTAFRYRYDFQIGESDKR